jgi:23S rRNA-/tRNA-specific pseudouridylate synthase
MLICCCQFIIKQVIFSSYVQPVVVRKWSKCAMKRGEVKVFRVEHRTLCKQNLASLVEICPSATKWHFLRVYLAHLLSPVLGDNLYGSRVHQVMGMPLGINPCSDAARGPKVNTFTSSE